VARAQAPGTVLSRAGRAAEAVPHHRIVLASRAGSLEAHYNLADEPAARRRTARPAFPRGSARPTAWLPPLSPRHDARRGC
jgi:hypothetical protein